MGNNHLKEPRTGKSVDANLYSLKKAKLPCGLFQGIAFHFYPHNAKVKFSPIKTPA